MVFTFDNQLASSIVLWLDNRICNLGQGFTNQSTQLYQYTDSSRSNYNFWAAPYGGWVYDSVVQNAIVPSGFYDNSGNFLTRSSGIGIDFNNGRVYSSGNLTNTLSGSYSQKSYQIYYSNLDTVNLFLERLYNENLNLSLPITGVFPYVINAPCIIVTNSYAKNEPWAFGGERANNRLIRLYTISNNNYNQDALKSIILSSFNFSIPLISDSKDNPINWAGDLKTGYYNYNDLIRKYTPLNIFIKDVYNYELSEKLNRNIGYSLSLFELEIQSVLQQQTQNLI